MTISTYDIGRTFTDQARELDALDRSVSELRYNLDELSEDQDTLKHRVSMLETDAIESLRSSTRDQDRRSSPGWPTHLARTPRTNQRRPDRCRDRGS